MTIRTMRWLASTSVAALAAIAAQPAMAEGTAAGTNVQNTVSISYSVNGVAQTGSAVNNFTVDRKINIVNVEAAPTGTTSVVAGQTAAATTFTITNRSNAVVDISLAATAQSTGTAVHGGTANFTPSSAYTYYLDNGDGIFNAADTLLTGAYIDQAAVDTPYVVHVVANIPAGQAAGSVSGVTLAATAREAGAAGALGGAITAAGSGDANNMTGMETVFADADGVYDGVATARDDYTVVAPNVSVQKFSRIISDPLGSTVPKAIPGAVVEYCIAVVNAGGFAATGVTVTDPLPTQTTYLDTFGLRSGATVTSGVCSGGAAVTPAPAVGATSLSTTIPTVNAGSTVGVYFRATIQ